MGISHRNRNRLSSPQRCLVKRLHICSSCTLEGQNNRAQHCGSAARTRVPQRCRRRTESPVGQCRTEWRGQKHLVGQPRPTGLVNDMFTIEKLAPDNQQLWEHFKMEPLFLEVADALLNTNANAPIWDRSRARHRAKQYMLHNGKLW